LIRKPKLYKDDLGSSTISFDKIPMLKSSNTGSKEVNIDKLSTIYSVGKDGEAYPKGQKRTVSTNTGPDLIYMLNNLKKRIFPDIKITKIEPKHIKASPFNKEKTEVTTVVPDSEDEAELRKRRKRNIERYGNLKFNFRRNKYSVSDYDARSINKRGHKKRELIRHLSKDELNPEIDGSQQHTAGEIDNNDDILLLKDENIKDSVSETISNGKSKLCNNHLGGLIDMK
jgi:hypothetical protein